MSRPIPSAREWLRMESETGRYCQHNLLCVAWAETALAYFRDKDLDLFHYITLEVLSRDLFITDN